jgi:TolB-like protein/Tfp pilus assembly protein PilF
LITPSAAPPVTGPYFNLPIVPLHSWGNVTSQRLVWVPVLTKLLEINLFGACIVRSAGSPRYEISGTKHRALFALLATAPFGRRTRSSLQDVLWGVSGFDTGRQSLRRALSDIKAQMGADYDRVLTVNNSEISLNMDVVQFVGRPSGGEFLEGLDIREDEFNDWLRGIRMAPEQLHALFSPRTQAAPPSMLPTIAVLPFRVVMGGPEDAVLGDWLAEEICRSLSRSNLLTVISHLSARQIHVSNVEMTQLRGVLGVDYCITGSLRIAGGQAVLDADCLETTSGRILWTRQFQGTVGEFMMADNSPVTEVVRTIGQTLASEAVRHAQGRAMASLADHQLVIAGVGLMHQLKLSSFSRSRELIEEAVRRAPRAAEAHAWLGEWYVMSVFNGWSTDRVGDTRLAQDCTARALDIEPENSFCLTIDGVVNNNLLMRMDVAGSRFDAALERNPNEAMAWLFSGVLHAYRDDGVEAAARAEKAMRLSPLDPFGYFYDSLAATAYLAAEDYERTLELAERSLAKNDRHLSSLRVKICALHNLGRAREAQETGRELMRRQPDFTVGDYRRGHPAADFRIGRNVIAGLLAVGIE